MPQPEIALLMSTYQRPGHLRLALESIAKQSGVRGGMELVVTDDGSTDETHAVIDEFRRSVDFRVGLTTHPHTTFRLARCRNEGVRASTAPYLLFLDGDCVLPADHVATHLARRQPGVVMAGDCCRLDRQPSEQFMRGEISLSALAATASPTEARRLAKLDRASRFYQLIRHPTKPKLFGNNVGIWRADYERVNGYDENFQGWGCEDDDLRYRLRKAGVRIRSILKWTRCYHLWHPTDVTAPAHWKQGKNVDYLLRPGRLTCCRNGLTKRSIDELSIRVVGRPHLNLAESSMAARVERQHDARPEVEILFFPGADRFSGDAECNVLVARDAALVPASVSRAAHVTIAEASLGAAGQTSADLSAADWQPLEQALGQVA